MTTPQELNDSFDSLAAKVLRVKAERDALLIACKHAYEELDERYDVDRDSEGRNKEYPFSGAGALMSELKRAIDKAEG
jgi:hypothetical protein